MMSFTRFLFAGLAAVGSFLTTGGEARADVFMVKDARGVVYFTNEKPSGHNERVLKRYTFSNPSPVASRSSKVASPAYTGRGEWLRIDYRQRGVAPPARPGVD